MPKQLSQNANSLYSSLK